MVGERCSGGKMVGSGQLAVMRWVAREVIVHEASLRSWLRRFAHADEIDDVVQESYCRIAKLKDVSHIRNGRAYLYTTARMIMAERARRAKVVTITSSAKIEELDVHCDLPSPEHVTVASDYFDKVNSLIQCLPERCREIFRLRKLEGLSQREVATKLGVPEHTVENDVAKGLSLILKAIAEGELLAERSLEGVDWREAGALSASN